MIRILVDSFADEGLPNAQMGNAREIILRLDPNKFHVSTFYLENPDPEIVRRPNTRLIQLPRRRQTVRIAREFLLGDHEILFYVKASPAARYYLALRQKWRDHRIVVGTMESQADIANEPTITPQAVRLFEQTILCCDYLFSNSSSVQRSLFREYGMASQVVPTGVDTKFFTSDLNRESNTRLCVLFVGSLRPFKGPQVVLEAAQRFPFTDFVLAGGGMMEEELRAYVVREQLQNVKFLGLLNAESLRKQYRQTDVFLFPSRWEGSPKVIMEAAACGVPVITCDDYEPETVIDKKTGYIAAMDEEILQRLEQLLNDPAQRKEMGDAGREHILNFDWDIVARKWEEVFIGLAADGRRRRAA
ncbi:MAG TPA: glycosyltransferase family 4 protein [Terriglobales bacterium]